MTAAPVLPAGFDPTDPDLCQERIPLQEFLELRKTAPVHWIEQAPEARAGFLDTGFWAISKHADIAAVSKNSKEFSANENGVIIRFAPDMTREQVELQSVMLVNQDPPDHTKTRQIISRGFTPRAIGALHEVLVQRANKIVDDALERGEGDFVFEVAAELPLQAIAELIGIPQEDRLKIFEWSNRMISYDDPEYAITEEVGQEAAMEVIAYAMNMAAERKKCPAKDIVTTLVAAEDEGNLASDEFGMFVLALAVAGNETTRNAISHGMHAFLTHPDQWELFKRERPATTAEEIVRWATPVVSFQRTATQDTELGGKKIKQGDRVGIFYASANHDPEVFENPDTFDITRDPNPHLGFGGGGPHFCLGKSLAVMETNLIFNAIADAMPGLHLTGDPRRLRSAWINGVKELQVSVA